MLLTIGPGLILAGTCIGVSHIVQSTRAGALYGFGLVWAVILANVFKFPFFEFAPRYVAATGEHLLHGYKKVGNWAFYLYLVLAFILMFPIQAAVTLICTGLFVNLFSWPFEHVYMSGLILLICSGILLAGKYPMLDKIMKVMIIILGISTVIAFLAAVNHGSLAQPQFAKKFVWDLGGISFLVALMGWMPSTIDISVWHSFWSKERRKQTNYHCSLKEGLIDFHIGYWGTMMMALLFLSLGALVMYGTGEEFSSSAAKFTGQVVSLYTKALGSWSYWIIATAAATTMFSTTLACLDAFPRVAREVVNTAWPQYSKNEDKVYLCWLIFVCIGALIIISNFLSRMKMLIDFATILSFLAAPIFAYINLRTVTGPHMPEHMKPSRNLQIFSWIGIAFLTGFSILFIIWRFFLSN